VSRICVWYLDGSGCPCPRIVRKGYSGVYGVDEFKVEFMKDAVLRDPYGTTHFAWLILA
jgi:hypothetical protein